ncbi:MAG TPA: thiol:disulfide interchange protein DsbA/DsbL [Ramlibacter sp.]|uniref:thiol:disulfide interchange protein DsbA/DsbL n=1 Tax=Ramlibacter sp. TaxID=1917967 RepID=UPI002CA61F9B|nr:thiol:disulfide interchange protein DsbA/DsbL [Ramlibacter sp.]HVZ46166.1 thiol:disulfide interchange protein DsbA/DsbL [Ramlibacter sp.]
MNRREFSLGAAAALGFAASARAQQRPPKEGVEYRALDQRQPVEAPAGKVEVVEFFWYSCPHCNAFEPKLVSWIKRQNADVFVRRVPVGFRDSFVPQQRLFYTLEALGKLDELHQKVFDAIHIKNQPTDREAGILDFAEANGLDRAKFRELYNSFTISTKARRASQLQDAYKVDGVPALGIAGRWYTDGEMAGNMDRALQVVDYLVAEARKSK